MNRDISITETEWKIMEVLWKTPGLAIGDIKNSLTDIGWSDSTVKTLVRRLVRKGAADFRGEKGHFKYYPLVNEGECRLRETKNLIDRIYHGSVKMLMASLASDSNLTEEETKQLMDIIEKMDGGE